MSTDNPPVQTSRSNPPAAAIAILIAYVATVALANVITATTTPLIVWGVVITWGTWFAGATFILRDFVQRSWGRQIAYLAIGAGLIISAAFSLIYADALPVAVGSLVAFAVSEALDTEIFTRTHFAFSGRVAVSGVIAGLIDTVLFVLIALSPLWSGILTWGQVPRAIVGVYVVKAGLQIIAAAILRARERSSNPSAGITPAHE